MQIGIIGLGYVGLTTGLGFCDLGFEVKGYDIDSTKMTLLKQGKMPFFEEHLDEILKKNIDKLFTLTNNFKILLKESDIVFICVPTPSRDDGSIDLSYVDEVAKTIGKEFKTKSTNLPIVAVKSTVIPGSTLHLGEVIAKESGLKLNKDFHMAMVPEFLRQGTAFKDIKYQDRIVIGVESKGNPADILLRKLFAPMVAPIHTVDMETAEFTKYASNSFLALKISFANQLANIVDTFNLNKKGRKVDIDNIVNLMGMDKRINPAFLGAGPGYGGSCFPKDVKALVAFSKELSTPFSLLEETNKVNEHQSEIVISHITDVVGSLHGKRIGIIGLTYKPNTDDIRVTPARSLIKDFLSEKAQVYAWDPQAEEKMSHEFPSVNYHENLKDFLDDNLDAAVIVTEWPEVKEFFETNKGINFPVIDTRRIYDKAVRSIGRSIKSS